MPQTLTILSNMGWRNWTYRRRQQVQQYFHDVFALVMLLIVAVVLILSEETKGRTLEDING